MSGAIQITPGYSLGDGEKLTEAILRQIANPGATVAPGAITETELDLPSVSKALGISTSIQRVNILKNGLFHSTRFEDFNEVAAPKLKYTRNAEGWWIYPSGADMTYGGEVRYPVDGENSVTAAVIRGATSVTTVLFGQDIPMSSSGRLTDKLQFSAWIHNNTGASFVPTLVVSTNTVADNFTTAVEMLEQDLETCKNEAWTQVSAQFDPANFANLDCGMRIAFKFPAPSLAAGGKTISIACTKLEMGESITPLTPDPGSDLGPKSVTISKLAEQLKIWLNPIGKPSAWLTDTAPNGWILAYGQNVSRVTYADLFAVFGTRYGVGDGANTFGMPDLRGKMFTFSDTMGGAAAGLVTAAVSGIAPTVGTTGGNQRMYRHTHKYWHSTQTGDATIGSDSPLVVKLNLTGSSDDTGASDSDSDDVANLSSQNMPPVMVANGIVFTGVFTA